MGQIPQAHRQDTKLSWHVPNSTFFCTVWSQSTNVTDTHAMLYSSMLHKKIIYDLRFDLNLQLNSPKSNDILFTLVFGVQCRSHVILGIEDNMFFTMPTT